MKELSVLILASVFLASCGGAAAPERTGNTAPQSSGNDGAESMIAHSSDRGGPAAPNSEKNGKSGWSRGGDPIDTTEFDQEIETARKAFDSAPNSEPAKKSLSEAYTKRGEALTRARQYAAALGDYRKALKLDPSNALAKQWIDQIVIIYEGLNKEYPKEGEEPEPLEFKKEDAG
ncbi:MAG: hypothetical protein DWQ47_00190 [Acidobacteria bacterium]|nr:MAG: hypothetical protein DWQ32_10650 [Acidobacteriota bacterium]REK03931.1 MAG: hypothetical protein DWQ38_00175 [Acidobacteriota bacterium]REK15093.1 MAG: hypothetical protein DWQ43_16340 [Acidobacteriota bacterium]REK46183.1 MAG: hypothetical protein DWQ47_00190 [Acidobacteriota bacterium]